jgi:hypothetical protein
MFSSHASPSAPMVERPGLDDPGQGCVPAPIFCTHKIGLALEMIKDVLFLSSADSEFFRDMIFTSLVDCF